MEPFSARMSVSTKPKDAFINYYSSIMQSYLDKRKQSGDAEHSEYDQFAEKAVRMIEDKSIYDIIAKSSSLYILPQNSSSQLFNPNDFFRKDSQTLLHHEFGKWFGSEEIAHLLLSETIQNAEDCLQNFFSLIFFSFFLDLSQNTNDSLYVAVSPGIYFKKWLADFVKPDPKTRLNLLQNTPSATFDSFTTFIIKTNVVNHDDIDSFLQKNLDTIIKYEGIAWIGNVAIDDEKLQWPTNLNMLTTFKKWFHIDIYKDIYHLND